jgi:hypothetical protein
MTGAPCWSWTSGQPGSRWQRLRECCLELLAH